MRAAIVSFSLGLGALGAITGESLGRRGGILGAGRFSTGVTSIGPFFDDANEYFSRPIIRSSQSILPAVTPISGSHYMIGATQHGTLLNQRGVQGSIDPATIMAAHKYYPQDAGADYDYDVARVSVADYHAPSVQRFGDMGGLLGGRFNLYENEGFFSGLAPRVAADNPARAALSRGSVTGRAAWNLRDRFADFGPLPAARPGLATFGSDGYVVDDRRGVANLSCPSTGCPPVGELTPEMQHMYNRYKQYFHVAGGKPAIAPAPIPFFQSTSTPRMPRSTPRVASTSSVLDQRAGGAQVHGGIAAMGTDVHRGGEPGAPSQTRDSFFGRIYQGDNEQEGNGRMAVGGKVARSPDQPSIAVEVGKAAYERANSGGVHNVNRDQIASHIGHAARDMPPYQ